MLLSVAFHYTSILCERLVVAYAAHVRRVAARQQLQDNNSSFHDRDHHSSSSSCSPEASSSSGTSSSSPHSGPASIAGSAGSGSSSGGSGDLRFSTYRIESLRERIQVLRCLVLVQVAEFAQLLARFRSRPEIRSGHVVLLAEAEAKVAGLRGLMMTPPIQG